MAVGLECLAGFAAHPPTSAALAIRIRARRPSSACFRPTLASPCCRPGVRRMGKQSAGDPADCLLTQKTPRVTCLKRQTQKTEVGLVAGVAAHCIAAGDATAVLYEVLMHAVHEEDDDAVWGPGRAGGGAGAV